MKPVKSLLASAAIALCVAQASVATAQSTRLSGVKARAVAGVEARTKLAQEINDSLFSFGELGYQEFETARYVGELLRKHGFQFEQGIAGMPSAWVARWSNGTGGPVIALGSDIDGIPQSSQRPGIPYHDPLIPGAPGHGEGHNSGQAVNIVAALAVKEIMERENIPGTLVLWPGVAEELLAGKAYMVREGVFKDVDAVLFTHVGTNLDTSWGEAAGTGLVSVEYTFHGRTAHSGVSPWSGLSALDAVELMNMAWDKRREHLRPEQRSHYVITNGGDQPNVVPAVASVWYYFREQTFDRIRQNFELGNEMSEAAAKMTGTTVSRRVLGSAAPRHFNRPIAEAAYANIRAVGLPQWTEDEQAFAKTLQRNINSPRQDGLETTLRPLEAPRPDPPSGGSDDIGDVSWVVPTITLRYPANIPGLPGHNWANAVSMATPIAHKGVIAGAKVMAMTTLDLLTKPKLLQDARDYFTNVQTKNQKYLPMIGSQDKPAIEMNAATMERFKPEMRKYYYDPARYPTYLEQLGIRFPVLDAPPAQGTR